MVGVVGVGIPVELDPGSAAMVKSKVNDPTSRRFAARNVRDTLWLFLILQQRTKGGPLDSSNTDGPYNERSPFRCDGLP